MDSKQPSRFEILAREDFSDATFLLKIHHPMMARAARPGQFVIVMAHEHAERIPLTIADFDREDGTVTLVIQAVGKSTREMQQICTVGQALHGIVGPMGMPSQLSKAKKVLCVGGGLGVAPVYPQARGFKENGACVIAVLGFRTRSLVFWQDKFESCCDEVIVCTDDGSAGIEGRGRVCGHGGTQQHCRSASGYHCEGGSGASTDQGTKQHGCTWHTRGIGPRIIRDCRRQFPRGGQ